MSEESVAAPRDLVPGARTNDLRVVEYADPDALARGVAAMLLHRLAEAQAAGREPHVALTGGTIADLLHREVARQAEDSPVDWAKVHVWWGDERFVAADSPDRNAGQARAALLDVVPLDPAKVHEMGSSDAYPDVHAAAEAYGARMRAHWTGEFEVLMLGMGPDGHVASLFPGFPQLDVDDRVAVAVTGSPKPPPERVSLTMPALNRSRAVWFLVTGDGKASAVASALAPGTDPQVTPAAGVRGRAETLWHLDTGAASRLVG